VIGALALLTSSSCAGGGTSDDANAGSPGIGGAFSGAGTFTGGGPDAGAGETSTTAGGRAGGDALGTGGSSSEAGGAALGFGGSAPAAGGMSGRAGSPGVGGGQPELGGDGPQFVGNITTGYMNGMDQGTRKFATYWDQVTPENAGKWGSVQASAGAAFNWTALDAIYDYAEKNKILFKEHTFIWGSQQPSGNINADAVQKWMSEFCKRYPNTKLIDVVNEPPPHTKPAYDVNIGGGTNGDWKWIANAFTWARAACPNAILIMNDYNNIEWSNDSAHFIDIVKKIQAQNAPIDAIGAQSHDLDHPQVTLATVTKLLADLNSQTGLPVYITEMDIDTTDDAKQLSLYQQYFPLFMKAKYVKGITIWGWIFGQTWSSAPNSGLIRNGSPRPAMSYLMDQLGRPAP